MEKQQIPVGYKQTEVGVIPEDWHVRLLKNISPSISVGLVINPSSYFDEKGRVPMLVGSTVKENKIFWEKANCISEESNRKIPASRLKSGDLVTVRVGEPGITAVIPPELDDCNCASMMIVRKAASFNSVWLCFVMNSPIGISQIRNVQYGTAQKQFNISDALNFSYPFPLIKEQTAIANALSDVDALIAALEKLIDKKTAIKTATMQQLLTGKKRLPPFDQLDVGYKQTELGEIPRDWEVKQVRELLRETPKYGINAAAVPLTANIPVYIRITDISEDGYFKPSERVGVNNQFSDLYKLKKGDIVLARTGASVGKSYLYRESDGELIYAGFLIKLSAKESVLNSMFLFQYLRSDSYWAWVNVMSMRSGQPGINGNEFGTLQIPLPNIEEQTAIANVLSDMDTELDALQQRLAKTQHIKQGMMQELLTGKTRLVTV